MPASRRRPEGRRVLLVGAPLLVAAVIATVLVVVRGHGQQTPPAADPVVARVGATDIHASLFEARVQFAVTTAEQGGAPAPSSAQYAAFLTQVRSRVMRSLIDDAVIAQEAAFQHLAATEADIDAEIAQDQQAAGGAGALQNQLSQAGSSLTLLRDQVRSRINESRLEDLFARQRADAALKDLQSGVPFTTEADRVSDDTTHKGGDLGSLSLDQLRAGDPAFLAAVLALPAGQVSATPARDDSGYEILRIDSATPTARAVHRILVAAPRPYTVRERPPWFDAAVLQAISDDCARGAVSVLATNAGGDPCAVPSASPSTTASAAPTPTP